MKRGPAVFDCTTEFDQWVGDKLENQDYAALEKYQIISKASDTAVISEHYIPMLQIVSLADANEAITTTFNKVW